MNPKATLCSHCRKRKAKRSCPALGTALCSLCCGLARNKEIHCPDDCPFLSEHAPYQQGRAVKRREASARPPGSQKDILADERLAWLAYHVEFPLKVYGEGNPGLTDGEAVMALEYARDKLDKAGRVLILPGESLRPTNPLGEAVLQSMDQARYEGSIILPGAEAGYSSAERTQVLDRVLLTARELARANPQGRSYIEQLIRHFARVEDKKKGK